MASVIKVDQIQSDTGSINLSSAISLTSGQLVFPATQIPSSNANTLDDYEEGTWTPVITTDTTAPTGASVSSLTSKYTKIGNVVHCFASFQVNKGSGGSGNYIIQGLPFSSSVDAYTPFILNVETLTGAKTNPIGLVTGLSTTITLYYNNASTSGMTPLAWSEISNNGWHRFSVTYFTS